MLRPLIFLLLVTAVYSQLKWRLLSATNDSDPFPKPRRDSSIGFDRKKNRLIIFGGRAGQDNFADTWSFDLSSNEWKELIPGSDDSIPEKRFSMVYGAENGRGAFYISTGEYSGEGDSSKRRFFNDIAKFDFDTGKWTRLSDNSNIKPQMRYGSAGGIFDDGKGVNGFYITHGFSGTRYSNTLKFDLEKNQWEEKFSGSNNYNPNYPHARCLHTGTLTKPDELVMYGGCLGGGMTGGSCPSKDNWKFDATKTEWTRLEECSTPRMYSAMAMLPPLNGSERRAVLYAGQETSKSVLVTSRYEANEIAVFNPDTNKWERKTVEGTPPARRVGHVMTTTDSGIVLFGGSGSDGDGLLNDIWLLEGTAAEADKNPSAGGCGSSDFNLVALHGIFMFIGWGVLLQAGAFIARYFRHKDPWWFKMHRGLQVTGLVLTIAGLICAFISVPFDHLKFAHGALGIIIMIIGVGQPLNAAVRPHKHPDGSRSTGRVIWELVHKNIGRLGLILALINISLGLLLAVAPVAAWAVWFALLGTFVIAYLVMEFRLRMSQRTSKTVAMPMK
ncbi:uncharacterized protein [Pocillopora verrucosa]|uniref:uncharacterized protein n=1 Tax=Pocillopora verrucosa TaxID=203993 RepID=UPI003340BD33